eukprot:6499232-Prymnesium_polylepis.1
MNRGRPFRKGSKRHIQSLRMCRRSPTSHTCRKHVYYSKGIKIDGREPRARSLTRRMLSKNKRGRIVSKKKSVQSSKRYHLKPNSGLNQWNEAAKSPIYGSDGMEFPLLDEDYDDAPYIPFSPQRPKRKSKRPKTPNKRPDFIYYGSRCIKQ